MIIEFGNHSCVHPGVDDRPKVTTIHVPESDDGTTHPDAVYDGPHPHDSEDTGTLKKAGPRVGGYSHRPGLISPAALKQHCFDAAQYAAGGTAVTHLPDHEALLAITAAWPTHSTAAPAWVKVSDNGQATTDETADVEQFLSAFYECPTLGGYYGDCDPLEAQTRKELDYWTRKGSPGEAGPLGLPDLTAGYTNDGRAMNNNNDGGDALQALMMGTGSTAAATTLTTSNTLVTNATAGHRVYVYTASGNVFVWGNCISNTNAGSASVITVDRWYVPITPGGSAGATPGTPWAWVLVDGGMVSTWFAGLATGANAVAAADHTLATNGNAEITTAGGTLIRKICPTASTSGVATRTVTLVPVFTANGTDSLPVTVTTIGFFASIVSGFGGAGGPMKFETVLTPSSATLSASGDNVTVTEVITGS